MINETFRSRRLLVALAALLTAGLACGGSSSSGGGGPTQPQPGVTFNEDGSPGANTVFMTDAPSGATTFTLEVRANQMDHVRGFGFDIEYPTNLLTFQSAEPGDFLGEPGVVDLLTSERTPGTIIVGITRFGNSRTVVSGSGLVVTLTFATVGSGTGPIEFENEQAFREFSSLTHADWLGGTVSVTQ